MTNGDGSLGTRVAHECDLGALGAAALAVCILPVQALAQAPAPAAEPLAESECSSLPPELQREGAAWRKPARALRALSAPGAGAQVQLGERVTVSLGPDATLTMIVTPRSAQDGGGFGGFVAFHSGAAGAYRVSLDDRAWIEVVARGVARPTVVMQSDKRMRCFGVSKNLSFSLAADTAYFVQLSGASRPGVGLLVSPPVE